MPRYTCLNFICMSQLHSALCKGEVGVDTTHKSVNIILNYIYYIWLLRSLRTTVCANPRRSAVCETSSLSGTNKHVCQVTSIPFLPNSDAGYELEQVVFTTSTRLNTLRLRLSLTFNISMLFDHVILLLLVVW